MGKRKVVSFHPITVSGASNHPITLVGVIRPGARPRMVK
jgi:hypothetical protein